MKFFLRLPLLISLLLIIVATVYASPVNINNKLENATAITPTKSHLQIINNDKRDVIDLHNSGGGSTTTTTKTRTNTATSTATSKPQPTSAPSSNPGEFFFLVNYC
jgi:archaellum component FlaF (FlaF/FlaG flagellin family)